MEENYEDNVDAWVKFSAYATAATLQLVKYVESIVTCHQAGPGTVNWKKFRALQTIDRVFPGAIGTLKEQIHITHFWSPTIGSLVSISILENHNRRSDKWWLIMQLAYHHTISHVHSTMHDQLKIA